jgi:hypothetical protein
MGKQSPALFEQLEKALSGGEGEELVKKTKVKRAVIFRVQGADPRRFSLIALHTVTQSLQQRY